MRYLRLLLLGLLVAGAVFMVDGHQSAYAALVTVTKTDDSNDGVCDADCSLREAIAAASSGDTVDIPAGTYTLTLGSQLSLAKDLTLAGAGAETTIIQAATSPGVAGFRVFSITRGNVTISGVTIRHGKTGGDGGGIYNNTTLTLNNSTISDNWAVSNQGGGIYNRSTLTLTNSTISGNSAQYGAAIYNAWGSATATLTNSTVSNNTATSGGGGGIYSWMAATVTLTNSTVSNNTADSWTGGGIHNYLTTLTMTNSTVRNNSARSGGGILNNGGTVTLINSTVSGNTADEWDGGGINNLSNSTVIMTNSTVSGNTAVRIGGGIRSQGTVELSNTIIANSPSGSDCVVSGSFTSLGYNLDSDGTCGLTGTGDLSNTDPLLGPLQDNGGPTFTHALLAGSLAIDAGDNAACPATDQRGVARPLDGDDDGSSVCDIGAYEYGDSDGDGVPDDPGWHEVTIPDLPSGASLIGVWTSASNDVYVAASRTTPETADVPESFLFHWDGAGWSEVLHLPGHQIGSINRRGVFGTGPSDVFVTAYNCETGSAAGCGPDEGTRIWRSTDGGTTWTPQVLPAEVGTNRVRSISGTPGNVHVSLGGIIIRFDGTSWSTIFTHSWGVQTLTLLGADEGYYTTCWGWGWWDGSSWQFNGVQFDFCDNYDIWGMRDAGGALHLYTVGNNNFSNGIRVWKFNEATQSFGSKLGYVFSDGSGGGAGSAYAIWGSAPDDIYVVGKIEPGPNNGRVYHYDGAAWQRVTEIGDIPLARAVWGTGSEDVWVVTGPPGRLFHYAADNCPAVPNVGQENGDADQRGDACETADCIAVATVWVTPPGDTDCDGFTTADENFMGTLPLVHCAATNTANDEGPPDAWPFDFNDDQRAALADALRYIPVFNTFAPGPPYDQRFDLNADGGIGLGDVLKYIPVINMTCAP